MTSPALKRLRVIAGAAVLVSGAAVFLFASELPNWVLRAYGQTQFIPSLLKFIYLTGGSLSLLFIPLLVFTLLTGRLYCSVLCPLGVLQDVSSRAGSWMTRKTASRGFAYRQSSGAVTWLWRSIGLATALLLVFGTVFLAGLLDPFSIFGRFMNHLAFPAVAGTVNLPVHLMSRLGIYPFAAIVIPSAALAAFLVTLFFFHPRPGPFPFQGKTVLQHGLSRRGAAGVFQPHRASGRQVRSLFMHGVRSMRRRV